MPAERIERVELPGRLASGERECAGAFPTGKAMQMVWARAVDDYPPQRPQAVAAHRRSRM